jgi:hypothetical protein
VIRMRRAQLSFGDGLIADEIKDLREPWMTAAEQMLSDEQLIATVYEAPIQRPSNVRGNSQALVCPVITAGLSNTITLETNALTVRTGSSPRSAASLAKSSRT